MELDYRQGGSINEAVVCVIEDMLKKKAAEIREYRWDINSDLVSEVFVRIEDELER